MSLWNYDHLFPFNPSLFKAIAVLFSFPFLHNNYFKISTFSLPPRLQKIISVPFSQLHKNIKNKCPQLSTTWPVHLALYVSIFPCSSQKKRKKERKGKESFRICATRYIHPILSWLFRSLPFCRILYLLLPTGFLQHFTHVQFSPYKQSRTTLSPPSCLPFYLPVFSSLSLAKLLENLVYTSCLRISISQPLFKPLQLGFHHLFTQTLSTRSSVTSLLPDLRAPFNCLLNRPSFSSCDMLFSFLRWQLTWLGFFSLL